MLKVLNNLSLSPCSDPHNPGLLLASLRAYEMLHVIMTTIEEEVAHKKLDTKPCQASLLDISNVGVDDDSDEDTDNNSFSLTSPTHIQSPLRSPLRRGMSLPPESPTQSHDTPFRDTVSVSRDSSPNSRFSKRSRSKFVVYFKLGEDLLYSSFTKSMCQTSFTG